MFDRENAIVTIEGGRCACAGCGGVRAGPPPSALV